MANLSIRKLDERVYQQLRLQAAKHGISTEEEIRQILSKAVAVPEKISGVFKQCFGSKNGVELVDLGSHKPHEPMDFS